MARMKDQTPIAEGDILLQRKEERAALGLASEEALEAKRPEHVGLASEARMQKRLERYEACAPVAAEILEEARSTLAVRFRFLDKALWRMDLIPRFELFGISSDGRALYYDPVYVVDRFKLSFSEVVRDVIHCLFHCIFRHPFMLYSVLRQPWDVACDIAIEALILDLVAEDFPSNMDRRAKESMRVLTAHAGGVVTAERLYWFFGNEGNKTDLKSLAPIFYHDTHGLWYGDEDDAPVGEMESRSQGEPRPSQSSTPRHSTETELLDEIAEGPQEIPRPQETGADASEMEADGGADASDQRDGQGGEAEAQDDQTPFSDLSEEELAEQWDDISRQMQVDLETHLARRGEGAGSLICALRSVHREIGDYQEFLKRFAALHETMRVNDDEFDYIYYTFGMDAYGNMPLIEPLEYKDDKRIRDFVIAIDTSESCSGEVVQAFMEKTYNILKSQESFHDRVNIHIIQCDAEVQEDTKITSLEQLERYLEDFELKGFGGTDFRPVFSYVDRLIEKGELTDVRGLLYFTDGEGVFPRRPPDYKTAFAFLDDGYSDPEVPSWALKGLIDERTLNVRDGNDVVKG